MYKASESIFTSEKTTFDRNKDIIKNLKFISTLEAGEKVDVRNLKIEQNNFFTPLRRMISGESRDTTLKFISNTIDRSFEIINSYVYSEKISEKKFVTNIVIDLYKTIKGLKNIQNTYQDDKAFCCNIEIMIEDIYSKMNEFEDRHPFIKDYIMAVKNKEDIPPSNSNSINNKNE
jgi:hypothetical protein